MAASFDYGDEPAFLIVADDPAAAAAAGAAIERAQARTVACVSLAEAEARLAIQARIDGLAIELAGVDADAIDGWLPPLAAIARDRHIPVIASLPTDSIDLAYAALGPSATLLTDPDPLDRLVAIAAALPGDRPGFREASDDEARIRQLSAEVARFAERLRHLSGEMDRGSDLREPPLTLRGKSGTIAAISPSTVRAVIRARRLRATALPGDLFADPAWDMLLDLYAAHLEDRRVSVSSLCIAANVPGTTALRWIGTMVDAGLFARRADPYDRRRAYIELSDRAVDGMAAYFASVARAGLHPA